MFGRSVSCWAFGAGLVLPVGVAAASCAAQTHVDLLQECDTPGSECADGRLCSEDYRCVPRDTFLLDGGPPSYQGGIVDLPDGGLPELLDGACATWESRSEPLPTSLMLIVDVSWSMNEWAPGGDTRWEVTHRALEAALEALPETTAVGLLLFPNRPTSAGLEPRPSSECVNVEEMVPIAPLGSGRSSQREALASALHEAAIDEKTPTHDAYVIARQELEWSALPENRHLLLITDGQPTLSLGCVEPGFDAVEEPIIDEIRMARQAGTRTFVIGSPGSEETERGDFGEDARTWLSRAATAGGTDKEVCSHAGPTFCHFDMVDEPDFSVALADALAEIAGEILPCDYELPMPDHDLHIDPAAVNVVWSPAEGTEKLFLRNDSADCQEGWRYVEGGTRIELCPQSCERVQANREGDLTLIFGCETEVLY
jgi:hypothetical protein